MTAGNLVGVWELLSFEIVSHDGLIRPWGQNCTGLLIYTSDGYMSAVVNREINDEPAPLRQAVRSVLAYAGTYSLAGDSVTHRVLNSSKHSLLGTDQIRRISLEGDTLTLMAEEPSITLHIKWRRRANAPQISESSGMGISEPS